MSSLAHLLERNREWSRDIHAAKPDFFQRLAAQQAPRYLWIGCSDSRVPANEIVGLLPGRAVRAPQRRQRRRAHRPQLPVGAAVRGRRAARRARDRRAATTAAAASAPRWRGEPLGLIDNWLRHVQDVRRAPRRAPGGAARRARGVDRLCELNVIEQVRQRRRTTIVQDAWRRGQPLTRARLDLRHLRRSREGPADRGRLRGEARIGLRRRGSRDVARATLIRLHNVTKAFPGPRPRIVLDRVSLDGGARRSMVAILGESGVGKSTLLNLVAGLDRARRRHDRRRRRRPRAARRRRADALRREQHRLRVPGLPRAAVPDGRAERRAAAGARSACATRDASARVARCSPRWASPIAARACRASSPAASCSASRSRARSCTAGARARRRADRQSRSRHRGAGARAAARPGEGERRGRRAGHAFARGRRHAPTACLLLTRDGLAATALSVTRDDRGRCATRRCGGALAQQSRRGSRCRCSRSRSASRSASRSRSSTRRRSTSSAAGMKTLSGDADLEVRGPRGGFDETLYRGARARSRTSRWRARSSKSMRASPGRDERAAHLSASTRFARRRSRRRSSATPTIALDVLRPEHVVREPRRPRVARRRGRRHVACKRGCATSRCTSRACSTPAGGERFAVMDIAGAQDAFERLGSLTRIDLRLRPGADVGARSRASRARSLPAGCRGRRARRTTPRPTSACRARIASTSTCSRWSRCSPAACSCSRRRRCRSCAAARSSRCCARSASRARGSPRCSSPKAR